jgi:putative ABC transport system permease protein
MARPPRIAERLLRARLLRDERDEIIGDLQEQFARRAADGPRAARWWYWRQTLALIVSFSVHRRDLVSRAHERTRGRWGAGNLMVDLRYAWRSLVHSRSFAFVALLTLTAGIGLSTAVFSLVSSVLLDPLPYATPDRIIRLSERPPGASAPGGVSDTALGAWTSMERSPVQLAAFSVHDVTVILPDGAANLPISDVSGGFFTVLSMAPRAGRLIGPSDISRTAPKVVVISERLARAAYGGVESAVGKTVGLESQTFEIVGVVASAFAFPNPQVDVWRPGWQYERFPEPGTRQTFGFRATVIGLLTEGATLEDVQRAGGTVAQRLAIAAASTSASEFSVRRLLDDMVAPIKPALVTLAAGMALVLIAACVNLTTLLLARHTSRQRELAVRVALGAGRWRVARPVLLELLMLSAGGGLAGGLLGWWLLNLLPLLAPRNLPRIESVQFDLQSLMFAAAVALATALAVGVLPALRLPSADVRELTSASGRIRVGRSTASADRLRSGLVAGQVALAVVLLVGALLIGRSLEALLDVPLGYNPEGVLTFQSAQPFGASREAGRLTRYYTELMDRLRNHSGVGVARALPLHPISIRTSINVPGRPIPPGRPNPEDMAVAQVISPDYLRAIGSRVVKGRGFTGEDTASTTKVILIDEVLERKHFPAGDAIGTQLPGPRAERFTIVGVVEATRFGPPGEDPSPVIYYSTEQLVEGLAYMFAAGIAVRTTADPHELVPFVREQARQVDATVPLYNIRPLTEDVQISVAGPRFFTIVLVLFATLALSTALLGIYGVLAYSVEQRRAEFGVRRALGAAEGDIVSLVLRRAGVLAAVGIAFGVTGAALGARFMQSMLFGITPGDPASYGGAVIVAMAIVLAASWCPVRRALRIDPAEALRVN